MGIPNRRQHRQELVNRQPDRQLGDQASSWCGAESSGNCFLTLIKLVRITAVDFGEGFGEVVG